MRRAAVIALVLSTVAAGACGGPVIHFEAPREPVEAVSHSDFDILLARYVDAEGGVDYQRWHDAPADVDRLDGYLGRLASASPKNRPDLFADRSQELVYWVNLYNALVVREVLRHWPIDSVGDIKPTIGSKLIPRRGFFRDTRFVVGGTRMSLDDIEHKVLRKTFDDARLHFAINCGSASCPVLRPGAYGAGELDAELDRAAREFINDPGNVRVDHEARTVRLSKLFEWYEEDFEADARRRLNRRSATVLDFVALYADADLAERVRTARAAGYRIRHADYDWAVNSGRTADPRIGRGIGDTSFALLGGGTFSPADHAGKIVVLDFWATYCKPCKNGLVELAAIADERPDVVAVAVSQDDDPAALPAYLEALSRTPTIAIDPEQSAASGDLAVSRLPTQIVIDRHGVIRAVLEGAEPGALARELDGLSSGPK